MGRKFKLINCYYGEDYKMFKKVNIEIEKGLTVLVGCNGTGKTTMLEQLEAELKDKDIPVLFHSNLKNGIRDMRDKAFLVEDFEFVALSMSSSEGENIVNVMGEIAREMGRLTQHNPMADELWFLFDAIDSGLSVDNIVEIKETLLPLVVEHNPNKDVYFVFSANEYELARNENCFDVAHGKYIKFKDYEDYRKFILKSRKEKDKRYD